MKKMQLVPQSNTYAFAEMRTYSCLNQKSVLWKKSNSTNYQVLSCALASLNNHSSLATIVLMTINRCWVG